MPDAPAPALAPAPASLPRRLLAELVGSAGLAATVIGSGIMATRLSDDVLVQLLVNALATVFGLTVLIATLGPISGAHFNPAVTMVMTLLRRLPLREAAPYALAQIAGCLLGAIAANLMFGLPAVSIATTERVDAGTLLAEVIATAGLVAVILLLIAAGRAAAIAPAVGAYIGAAYFFTSSTSFANPAITIGRIISDTFAGIAPASAAPFIAMQLLGALVGLAVVIALVGRHSVGMASARTQHRAP